MDISATKISNPHVTVSTARDVTALLHAWTGGDLAAREQLMPLVYDELRRRAAAFYSGRPGGSGGQDLWTATRETVFDPWSAPVNLGRLVNSATIDQRPYLASDRETLFFASDRPGGYGGVDLYLTSRVKHGGRSR